MVSLRKKAVKRILLLLPFLVCKDSLLLTGKHATLRTKRIFARKLAGKFEKSELSLEESGQIIGRSRTTAQKFALTKTIGIRKIRRIFFKLRSHYFCKILYQFDPM